MSLPRCPHGVYNGTEDGEPTIYCSGCYPPQPLARGAQLPNTPASPFPYGKFGCPRCGSKKKFKYVNDWEWHCNKCGADALDDDRYYEEDTRKKNNGS